MDLLLKCIISTTKVDYTVSVLNLPRTCSIFCMHLRTTFFFEISPSAKGLNFVPFGCNGIVLNHESNHYVCHDDSLLVLYKLFRVWSIGDDIMSHDACFKWNGAIPAVM